MKSFIQRMCFFFLFLSCSLTLLSQRPQRITGIAKEQKSIEYYAEQSRLWQELIEKDRSNAEAWHHHYKAERAKLQLESPDMWANQTDKFYATLDPIIERAKEAIGDEFEYHYIRGLNSPNKESIVHLQKAYEIDPERSEVYGWLFSYYLPRYNEDKIRDLAKRMIQSNIYSDANLKWNYNALQTVEENGLIITNGDMDGSPKFVLQYGLNVRPDVLTISKWLLTEDDYREIVFKKIGIEQPQKSKDDFDKLQEYVDYLTIEILTCSARPSYISAGTPIKFFRDHQIADNIFLVGNALKYSKTPIENTSIIENNYEHKYYLEYLLNNFQRHHEDDIVKKHMNLTYLPGLIHLRGHYKKVGNEDKLAYYDKLIDRIANESGRKDEVLGWFE